MIDIEKLKELDAKASVGPWSRYDDQLWIERTWNDDDPKQVGECFLSVDDAALICELRNNVSSIISLSSRVSELEEALDRISRIYAGYGSDGSDYDDGYKDGLGNAADIARKAMKVAS